MRLANVSDIAAANRFLDDSFLASLNAKFEVAAADLADAHRATASGLDDVLCEHHQRKVSSEWCVQRRGTLLQIDPRHEALNLPGKSVTLRDRTGAATQLLWQEQALSCQPVSNRPKRAKPKPMIVNNRSWKAPADHPWR